MTALLVIAYLAFGLLAGVASVAFSKPPKDASVLLGGLVLLVALAWPLVLLVIGVAWGLQGLGWLVVELARLVQQREASAAARARRGPPA